MTKKPPKVILEECRSLYFDQGRTLQQIADRYGETRQEISDRLISAGVERRPQHRRREPISREVLFLLYVGAELSLAKIAVMINASPRLVRRELERHGIPPRPLKRLRTIDREVLTDLYLDQGLPVKTVAKILRVHSVKVMSELRRHDITFRHKGGRQIDEPQRETLVQLYVTEGFSALRIAKRIGVSDTTMRKLFRKHGIDMRTRKRIDIPERELYEMYVAHALPVKDIAEKFGITAGLVYANLRRYGINRRALSKREKS